MVIFIFLPLIRTLLRPTKFLVLDIAVGAYKSGHVVVLLSKPEVKVDTVLEPNTKRVTTNTTAITLKLCFNYTGLQAPRKLIIDVRLGADKRFQRTDMLRQKTVFNGIAVFNKSLIYEKLDCEDIVLRIKVILNILQNLKDSLSVTKIKIQFFMIHLISKPLRCFITKRFRSESTLIIKYRTFVTY